MKLIPFILFQNRLVIFLFFFVLFYSPFFILLGLSVPGGILELDLPISYLLPFDLLRGSYQTVINSFYKLFLVPSYNYGNYVIVMGRKVISINNSCLGFNYFSLIAAFSIVFLKNWSILQIIVYQLVIYVLYLMRFIILIELQLNNLAIKIIDHHYIFDAFILVLFLLFVRCHFLKNELKSIIKVRIV
jgi:hypothetical protein